MSITDSHRNDIRNAVKHLLDTKVAQVTAQHQFEMDALKEKARARLDAQYHFSEWLEEYKRLDNILKDTKAALKEHVSGNAEKMFLGYEYSRYRDADSDQVEVWFKGKVREEYEKDLKQADFYPELKQCEKIWAEVDVMITLATNQAAITRMHNRLAELLGVPLSEAMLLASDEGLRNL